MEIYKTIVLVLFCIVAVSSAAVVSPPDIEGLGLWYSADDLDGDGVAEGVGEDGLVNASEYVVVSEGKALNARKDGWWIEKYYHKPGMEPQERNFIEISGTDNYLYAQKPVGEGDFHISARLALFNIDHNTPAFACNSFYHSGTIDAFFFNWEGDLVIEGRLFGLPLEYDKLRYKPCDFDRLIKDIRGHILKDRSLSQKVIAGSGSYITEGEPFLFEVKREGKRITFLIDSKIVAKANCPISRFGEVGFRSLGANLRLYDFCIKGKLLDMEDYLLNISDKQRLKLEEGLADKLFELKPVHLPEGDKLVGRNWHFGHPVSTIVDDTIVLCTNSGPCHDWGKSDRIRDGLEANYDLVSTSSDGGKSWTVPQRLVKYKTDDKQTMGSMCAIGTTSEGNLIQVSKLGCYRSDDKGKSWEYLSGAFTAEQVSPGPSCTMGPKLIETSYGMTGFQGLTRRDCSRPGELWLRYSRDEGNTWQQTHQVLPVETSIHGEPAALMYQGSLIILARIWSDASYDADEGTYRYGQFWSKNGRLPVSSALTNIKATEAVADMAPVAGLTKSAGFGPWSQDTPELIYNPVSKRIEAVVTNRCGGGQGYEQDMTVCTLNLWSIDPQELLSGGSEWIFEGTLLERDIVDTPKFHDGMHPAGGVVDLKNNQHHIFVYMGYYDGPAGIFRISISLDTPKVSEFLKK